MINLTLSFSGGLEILTGHREMKLAYENEENTLQSLFNYVNNNVSNELFVADKIRPGILVLVNDVDYEIEGENCEINDGDEIVFIGTLHGG